MAAANNMYKKKAHQHTHTRNKWQERNKGKTGSSRATAHSYYSKSIRARERSMYQMVPEALIITYKKA